MTPKFTAVLTNYNHSQYLPTALGFILNQTVLFDEIIIIDDGSGDNSVEIIEQRIKGVPNARLIVNAKNTGVVASQNVSLKESTGDFIFYFAADDQYSLHIVEWARNFLSRHPDVGMISGNARMHWETTGKERAFTLPFLQTEIAGGKAELQAVAGKRNLTFLGGANLMRRDAMIRLGGFMEPLRWHSDWFLYLAIAWRHGFGFIPQEFVRFRIAEDQYSHACHDWKRQKPVIEAFVKTVLYDYPDLLPLFRNYALMPTYEPRMLALLLCRADLRPYLTPLLAWRLLSYKPLRLLGKFVPVGLREQARRLLRV